jgi:stage IV sporulation protein FB
VGDAYNKYALTLTHGDHVSKVIEYILQSYQPDYAVLHGDQLMGVVTRDDVLRALSTDTRDLYVSAVMQRDVLRVSADQSLDDVRQKLMQEGKRLCAVFEGRDDAHYLGLVSLEDIQEALLVASFAERQREMRVRTA